MVEDKPTEVKREVAFKVKIRDILEGNYVKEEGWKPNYILTKNGEKVARVNLFGVVVSEPSPEEKYQSIVLDDGSDRISVRSFDDSSPLNRFMLGDVVNVIGKPKEYNNTKYIVSEIIRIIGNKQWLGVRKKEIELKEKKIMPVQPSVESFENEQGFEEDVVEEQSDVEKIIELIRKLDAGDGVFIENILVKFNSPVAEKIISSLIEQGDIFEVQPGKVKVLE